MISRAPATSPASKSARRGLHSASATPFAVLGRGRSSGQLPEFRGRVRRASIGRRASLPPPAPWRRLRPGRSTRGRYGAPSPRRLARPLPAGRVSAGAARRTLPDTRPRQARDARTSRCPRGFARSRPTRRRRECPGPTCPALPAPGSPSDVVRARNEQRLLLGSGRALIRRTKKGAEILGDGKGFTWLGLSSLELQWRGRSPGRTAGFPWRLRAHEGEADGRSPAPRLAERRRRARPRTAAPQPSDSRGHRGRFPCPMGPRAPALLAASP